MEGYRDGTGSVRIEEEAAVVVDGDVLVGGRGKERLVFMWGYLPGASRQRAPLLYPVSVRLPPSAAAGFSWRDVCGGGCGFAVAISDTGKLITWGSTDDLGQSYVTSGKHGVWGWGYGGEGQLGLGSRIRMVSSPHLIPCTELSMYTKDRSSSLSRGGMHMEGQGCRFPGTYIKGIACGGRHSAVITDAGALLTFGWGLYGQCGQGSTDDELSPTCVSSLLGIRIQEVAAGLWHTVCISADGDVYSFGGNQFGQLGTGVDQAEVLPRLLDASSIENTRVKGVSCGARHSAVITEEGQVFCWGWNKYGQIEALKANGVTEVVLAMNYQPEVIDGRKFSSSYCS
ncbi:hypothetical protein QQ045_005532 [Rhodiola kirilowii]